MVFSSFSFLFLFLPILVLCYYLAPTNFKNIKQYILLLFSLVFYGLGEPLYIILIVFCISLTWFLSKYIKDKSKLALVLSIIINITPLIITKYLNFIIENINNVFNTAITMPNIAMPIGISFYTFQVITYVVDLYNQKIARQNNPLLFALYIMFFAQLVAGPIVKYSEISKQIEEPDINWDNIKYGVGRFIKGLGKKVIIANQGGFISTTIFENDISSLNSKMAWLAVISYTIQIYFDFSGYSDIAIGLGYLFGFHFPENFDNPYTSKSISEFWRKWHITLGRFFREYVYIPLGGNRVSKTKWILNIFVVWSLTGLWHGAAWNYIMWGLFYGVLIVFERITGIDKKLPEVLSWALTQLLVMFGWAIFMCDSLPINTILEFLSELILIDNTKTMSISSLSLWSYIPFLLLGILLSSPIWIYMIKPILDKLNKKYISLTSVVNDIYLIIIFVISIMFLMGGTYNPFIYFRF